jgi:transcriptional regulator with XRE-family HTH domain
VRVRKSELEAQLQRWRLAAASVIAASRRDADLTQRELAKKVGWSRDRLAKMELGLRQIELGHIVLLAEALNERPELLIRRILMWNG